MRQRPIPPHTMAATTHLFEMIQEMPRATPEELATLSRRRFFLLYIKSFLFFLILILLSYNSWSQMDPNELLKHFVHTFLFNYTSSI